jgi:hypothetical protein
VAFSSSSQRVNCRDCASKSSVFRSISDPPRPDHQCSRQDIFQKQLVNSLSFDTRQAPTQQTRLPNGTRSSNIEFDALPMRSREVP